MQVFTVLLTELTLTSLKIGHLGFGLNLDLGKYSHDIIFHLIQHGRKHLKCFPFVLLLGIFLGVAPQSDSLSKMVHLSKMLFPLFVQRFQHHGFFQMTHYRLANRRHLLLVNPGDFVRDLVTQSFLMKIVIGLQPVFYRERDSKMPLKILLQRWHIPLLLKTLGGDRPVNNLGNHLFPSGSNCLRDVVGRHQGITLVVDHLALLVCDIVVFQELLTDVEIASFNFFLGVLDSAGHPRMLNRLTLFHAEFFHQPGNTV